MEDIQQNMEQNHEEDHEGDLMYEAHAKIDALIDLLVRKGVINEDEYDSQVQKLLQDLESCECSDCGEDPCACEEDNASAQSAPSEGGQSDHGCGCGAQHPSF
tara:strand:+ start:1129 stop:1437 length:309 start_codon:yes stop_codon:yes gene_type:complete